MALSGDAKGKLETVEAEIQFKSNAERFFKIISDEHHDVPKASSDKVHQVEIHEGDWKTSGSIKIWKYTVDGVTETLKEKVEIDEGNKKVSFTALEGHILDQYKSFKFIFQVTPKNDVGGSVKITIEFEKLNANDLPPQKYLRLLINILQDIDAHLLKE